MTTFTPRINLTGAGRNRARAVAGLRGAAFTLTEVIIASTLAAFVMAGVLSAFLMLGRTGFVASAYSELDAETRRALTIFGEDVRNASGIHWNSSQSVTLSVAASAGAIAVTYAYDTDPTSATYGSFYRLLGDASSTLPRYVLIHNVGSDFAFHRYKVVQPGVTDNAATSDLDTKQLQITWQANRSGITTPGASQASASASYVLRNKVVGN
jgi:hypothetical protein